MTGKERRVRAEAVAAEQGGVLSRRQLRTLGITHDHVRHEVTAQRWTTLGRQAVAVHRGPLPVNARAWAAVWEVGERVATLDGVTALAAGGLTGFDESRLHLSVRHTHTIAPVPGVTVHKLIRRVDGEVLPTGIPRVRPAVATVRAAGWAVTDRQAALLLLMPVQQGLVTPASLREAATTCLGRRRRRFITTVIADMADGVRALGELDFARLCRVRGLPEPTRQSLREGPRGRLYLDVHWQGARLVVEIDGVQHRQGIAVSLDNLGRNSVALAHDTVLRIDLVGLRLFEDEFMEQVAAGLGVRAARSR
ncbi:hypothetical protein [Terracoccus luteus]|uniref:hypothetical protein n=1 Tax=Terracoccus luteus TaxID=53356 RepID=UPI000EAB6951|nr:hypothetical protein [Terracoccus luteus]